MNINEKNTEFEKKKQLFLSQKGTLDTFLANGAINRAQYDKSYGDLVRLMGMEEIAKNIEEGKI